MIRRARALTAPGVPSGPVTAAAALVLAGVTWQVESFLPRVGFDHSWQIALHLAAVDRLAFGRDVVFTYGPLGFLSEPLLVSRWTGAASFLYALVAQVALAAVVVRAAARSYGLALGALAAFVALGAGLQLSDVPVYLAFFAAVWMLEREEPVQARWLAPLCGAVAAIGVLVKVNSGVVCLLLVVLAAWRAAPGGVRGELVLLGSFAVALVGLWLATGNALVALPTWIGRSREVVSGYTNAVALPLRSGAGELLEAAVLLLVAAVALSTRVRRLPRRRAAALLAVAAVYAFAYVKEGFVRADFHSLYFFGAFGLSVLAFAWRGAGRRVALALVAGAAAAALAAPQESAGSLYRPIRNVRTAVAEARAVVSRGAERRDVERARAEARARLAVPPPDLRLLRGHTVDVVPYETSAVWAYGLDWRGEPLLQWYTAFTGRLDRMNARSLVDEGAERILRQRAPTMDAKVGEFEAPATYLALVCRYRELASDGSWQVLARTPDRCGAPHVIGTAVARSGDTVTVPPPPHADDLVYARIRVGRSIARMLASVVFKPAQVPTIQIGGTFRFLPETADGPLVLRMPARSGFSPLFGGDTSYAWFRLGHVRSPFAVEFVAQSLRGSVSTMRPAPAPRGSLRPSEIRVAGRRYRLRAGRFTGWVDAAAPAGRAAVVAGWAVDPDARRPAPLVAVFAGPLLVAVAKPTESRPDVAQGLHVPAYATAGYSATFVAPRPGARVRVFALGAGTATELTYPAGYRWR